MKKAFISAMTIGAMTATVLAGCTEVAKTLRVVAKRS